LLAFLTGLDTGEIAGLSWEHVDLDAKVPVVRVTRCFKESGEYGPTKRRDRVRTVPLHPLAATMLRARRASQWVELVGRRPQQTDPVFPDRHGKPHYRHDAAPALRADLKRIGLSAERGGHAITMKSARRSFATWLHEAGVEETVVGRLMGHASKTVTGRHYTANDLERLYAAVRGIRLDLRAGEVVALPVRIASGSGSGGSGPTYPTARSVIHTAVLAAVRSKAAASDPGNLAKTAEVRTGFEPAYNGFANRCLTAWLPHHAWKRADLATSHRQDQWLRAP